MVCHLLYIIIHRFALKVTSTKHEDVLLEASKVHAAESKKIVNHRENLMDPVEYRKLLEKQQKDRRKEKKKRALHELIEVAISVTRLEHHDVD